jgi:RES domain-containing protein
MRLQTIAYRALNPIWVRDPLSGEGARRFGGRFNAKGTPALYLALDAMTAVREVSQIGQPLQPTVLVSFHVDVENIFDATNNTALAAYDMTLEKLAANDWRLHSPAPTQTLAARLIAAGHNGMFAPSYARGTAEGARNLILWHWGPDLPTRVTLIDDEGRLTPAPPRHAASVPPSA